MCVDRKMDGMDTLNLATKGKKDDEEYFWNDLL
jgi:hypothetical protein